ncbi:MAG: hypothetical protein ABJH68_15460 [Ilumatobacter sp.]|uniref:hypothetical protein n=1 Tax=Ilumatobacter sp. TaxID=1967498 RepID=UPI0032980A9F
MYAVLAERSEVVLGGRTEGLVAGEVTTVIAVEVHRASSAANQAQLCACSSKIAG